MPRDVEFSIGVYLIARCTRCGRRYDLSGMHEVTGVDTVLECTAELDECPGCHEGGPDDGEREPVAAE